MKRRREKVKPMYTQRFFIYLVLLVTRATVDCFARTSDDPYFQIASSGLTPILWSRDGHFDDHLSNLSRTCSASLRFIYHGIHRDGRASAYTLLDASSKMPSGVLDGTTGAFGNYDGCLALQLGDGHGNGKYCTVTMALEDPGNSSAIGSLYYRSLPYLKAFDLSFGLCFPSTCTTDEIEAFVVSRTSKYPIKLAPYKEFPLDFDAPVTCDTLEETTFLYRLKNLSRAQIISLILALILPTIVVVSSFLTLIGLKGRINDFSAQRTIKKLLVYEEPADASVFTMEAAKVTFTRVPKH